MSAAQAQHTSRCALLDTTVSIDRLKIPARGRRLEALLADFEWTVTTSISQMEFKAVLIQELVTIHNKLAKARRFLQVRDELIESSHPQHKLRAHIFNNLIAVFAPPGEIDAPKDARLAEQARLELENMVPRLFAWFRDEATIGGVIRSGIDCTRAKEPPTKQGRALSANLPLCRRGKNKSCRVESFLREAAPPLLGCLAASNHESDQLHRAADRVRDVLRDADADLSHSDCRSMGDLLIALEARHVATHAVSSNSREWQPLSDCLGFEFVKTEFAKLPDDDD